MATIVLPATADDPWYDFTCTLEGRSYRFEFRWNERSGAWFLSLADVDGTMLAESRRVMLAANLLGRSASSGLPPGTLLAVDTSGADEEAGRDDLGERVKIVYVESGG